MKPTLAEAIERFDAVVDAIGGCGDGGCLVKKPIGVHTNGGCRCWTDKMKAQRVMHAAKYLRSALPSKQD